MLHKARKNIYKKNSQSESLKVDEAYRDLPIFEKGLEAVWLRGASLVISS
jgi:hypothetical protein